MSLHMSEEQNDAVTLCTDMAKRIVGVTGRAGCGKTTILKYAYENLKDDDITPIALAAPTGRAAKRIQEATGIPAMTIHRMMKYAMPLDDEDAGLPAHNKDNPLPYRAIFIDEASMVDNDLYRNVIDAMPNGSVIRFFGDANQLPPVKGDSPFLKILDKWPSIELTHNFRSSDGIVSCATSILEGRTPRANDKFNILSIGAGDMLAAAEEFIDDSYRGLNSQIIIPTKKGKYGTSGVNHYLQQKLNPKGERLRVNYPDPDDEAGTITMEWRVGDKVIQTKNDYQLKLFNGQIGHVTGIDTDDGTIVCQFEEREYVYPCILETFDEARGRSLFRYDPRKNLELAYAVTTHKAQGSEFETILLMLNRSWVLNRANFYTAVTRAKSKVHCLMGPGALQAAMSKGRSNK